MAVILSKNEGKNLTPEKLSEQLKAHASPVVKFDTVDVAAALTSTRLLAQK